VTSHTVPIRILLLILLLASNVAAQTSSLQTRLKHVAALIRDNRFDEAEQQLNLILKASPDEASALNLFGTIRAQQGRLNEAENTLFPRRPS